MIYNTYTARIAALSYPDLQDFADRSDFVEARSAYNRAHSAIEQEFAAALGAEYLSSIPQEHREAAARATYSSAYSIGHGSGYSDVENYYIDLADVAIAGFQAGQATRPHPTADA